MTALRESEGGSRTIARGELFALAWAGGLSLLGALAAVALFEAARIPSGADSCSPLRTFFLFLLAADGSLSVLGSIALALIAATVMAIIRPLFPKAGRLMVGAELACLAAAVCLCYLKLTEYERFLWYPPFIALHAGALAVLAARTLLSRVPGSSATPRRSSALVGSRLLPAATLVMAAALLVLNYEIYYDRYPTLHTCVLMLAFLLLQSGAFPFAAALSRRPRGKAPAMISTALLGAALASAIPLSTLSSAQAHHPDFARFTVIGQELARLAWDAENTLSSTPGKGAFDPDGVERFAEHSGLPPLPDDFDLHDYNILLISIEATRANETSMNNPQRNLTPRLLDYARSGAHWFTRAFTGSAYTVQSIASLFTMSYPSSSGLRIYNTRWSGSLDRKYQLVPDHLDEAGYDTFWVPYAGGAGEEAQLFWVRPHFGEVEPRIETEVLAGAKRQLSERKDGSQRFFGWVFFSYPHSPYLAHYSDMPAKTDMDLYRQDLRYADKEVGELPDHLEDIGLDESTIVIIHADHGEEFKDHGKEGHMELYSECSNVPLIVKIPGLEGRRSDAPTSVLYVFPWLFSKGDSTLRSVARHRMERIFGPVLEATDGAVVSEMFSTLGTKSLMVHGDYHFHHDFASKRSELYDIRNDPGERSSLFDAGEELSKAFLARFERYDVVRKAMWNVTFDAGDEDAPETQEEKTQRMAEQKRMRKGGEDGYGAALRDSKHWKVQMEASKRLCARPSLKTETIDLLVKTLTHENREVRKHHIRYLGAARAPGIDERLLHAIRSDSPLRTLSYTYGEGKRRSMSAAAASMLKRRGDNAIPATIASLESDDLELLRYASRAVGGYGPKAIAAIPRLKALAVHPDSAVRKNALRSLGQISGGE